MDYSPRNRPEPATLVISPEEYDWLVARLAEDPRELPRLRALVHETGPWD